VWLRRRLRPTTQPVPIGLPRSLDEGPESPRPRGWCSSQREIGYRSVGLVSGALPISRQGGLKARRSPTGSVADRFLVSRALNWRRRLFERRTAAGLVEPKPIMTSLPPLPADGLTHGYSASGRQLVDRCVSSSGRGRLRRGGEEEDRRGEKKRIGEGKRGGPP